MSGEVDATVPLKSTILEYRVHFTDWGNNGLASPTEIRLTVNAIPLEDTVDEYVNLGPDHINSPVDKQVNLESVKQWVESVAACAGDPFSPLTSPLPPHGLQVSPPAPPTTPGKGSLNICKC